MSNSKEKDIVLYELSDKLNYTICLKIPSEPPITVKKSKLDSAKSWESKKNNIEKNKSIECTFDDNLKYRLIFNVVTTPTILNVRNRNYQEKNLSEPSQEKRVDYHSSSGESYGVDSIPDNLTKTPSDNITTNQLKESHRIVNLAIIFAIVLGIGLISFLETGWLKYITPSGVFLGIAVLIVSSLFFIFSFVKRGRTYRPLKIKKKSKNRDNRYKWFMDWTKLLITPVIFCVYFYFLYYFPYIENNIATRKLEDSTL